MGRKPNQRQRVGHLEKRQIRQVIARIRRFPLRAEDSGRTEADLNRALNTWIQGVEPNWTDNLHVKVPFAGTNFNPDGTLPSTRDRPPLLAYEGKKLVEQNPQKAWKEGLGQAFTYRVLFKAAILVLYDFTHDARYARGLGRGNSAESSFSTKVREKWRIYTIAIHPVDAPPPAAEGE